MTVDSRQSCREGAGRDRPEHRATGSGEQFSLYVHIPYCLSKCPYCDFNSYAATRWPEAAYTDALIAELETYAGQAPWRCGAVETVFFGGGTPSLFAPRSIGRVLDAIGRLWPDESRLESRESRVACPGLSTPDSRLSTSEITLEANPGTVTLDTLRGFRVAGVNRISFGVQSFHTPHLIRLGRIHSGAEAVAAIRNARAAGFDNLNLDLIFAVPGQTLAEWEADLRTATALAPDHVSAYNLTFEEGTAFHALRARGELVPQPEEIEVAMFSRTRELLAGAGYEPYEISNFARPARACRHNLNYWRAGAYLGIGAGAHSFARVPEPGARWSNARAPHAYIEGVRLRGHARTAEESLSVRQARGEFVFLGLRCREGIDAAAFARRFGIDLVDAFPHAAGLHRDGLLDRAGSRWTLSERGLLLADSIFATFL